jgi:hypothetical protein
MRDRYTSTDLLSLALERCCNVLSTGVGVVCRGRVRCVMLCTAFVMVCVCVCVCVLCVCGVCVCVVWNN